jgi:hypothetical protein
MAKGFVDPRSPFAGMAGDAIADDWGKKAADLARTAGKTVDIGSVEDWLDQSEPYDVKQLKATDSAVWHDLRDRAAGRAETHAQFMAIWRG